MGDDPVHAFPFDADERWRAYLGSLEFAGAGPSPDALLRLQRRWYKANIDPAYDPASYGSGNSSRSAQQQSQSQPDREPDAPPSGSRAHAQRPAHSAAHERRSPAQYASVGDHVRHNLVPYARFGATVFLLVNAALYVVFMLPDAHFSYECYRRAFKGALLAYALSLYEAHWPIRFSRETLATILMDSNCQYLIYSIAFLGQPPMLLALAPLCVYAVYSATDFGRIVAQVARAEQPDRLLAQAQAFLSPRTGAAMDGVALMEILLFPFMLLGVILGQMGLSTLALHFMFLRTRYFTSPHMQSQFRVVRLKADEYVTRAPAVRPFYGRVVTFLSSLGEMR